MAYRLLDALQQNRNAEPTMSRHNGSKESRPSRRRLLKGAAALGGAALGSSIGGFPTIWAQNIKDVVLRHAGAPVTAIPRIAEQATKDLGFTIQKQQATNQLLVNDGETSVIIRAGGLTPETLAGLSQWGRDTRADGDHLSLTISEDSALPAINRYLVSHGCDVYAITPQRLSLEDLFIQIVGTDGGL